MAKNEDMCDFDERLSFLAKHEWIYNFPVTEFLERRVWEQAPEDWLNCLSSLTTEELNAVPFGFSKSEWPASLRSFIDEAVRLSTLPPCEELHYTDATTTLNNQLKRGMNPKKQHEVSRMAALVSQLCHQENISQVVDVGSGLGYLGQVLCSEYGLNVLGLESKDGRTHGATNMAASKKLYHAHLQTATFELEDSEQSFQEFNRLLEKHFPVESPSASEKDCSCSSSRHKNETVSDIDNSVITSQRTANSESNEIERDTCTGIWSESTFSVCMVGLHCCADLSPTMLKLFSTSPRLKCIVCFGCCYHNMKKEPGEPNRFTHFPLSDRLKTAYHKVQGLNPHWSISQYALRLAAQETRARWKLQTEAEHKYHAVNVAYRALLQMYCSKVGVNLQKCRRRVATKADYESFERFLQTVLDGNSIPGDTETIHQKILQLHDEYQQYFHLIEPFTCLQVLLQPVLESLVLLDRHSYLLQHPSLTSATLLPVFDDAVSPRNVAVLACKH